MSQSGGPPYLTPGTEVSAKYKGAFCEAKIKRCQKSVKCKVAPRDGGPQISVTDDAVQGDLKIGGPVKVRQPDSGQIIDGNISRIIDSSIYTVVFDDGDVATLKRTQICLKGDKHYMEGDTLDKLPLTNPEHFSTPVNLMKKERRRRPGYSSNQSSVLSDDSDVDDEATSISRRISPRAASKSALDVIGKVVSVEIGDKKKWAPALVVKPSSAESDAKGKGSFTVKSFRDNKITSVTERQVREFSRDLVKTYSDDRLTKAAVDKALKYINTKELPASWKKDDLLGVTELSKQASLSQSKTAASSVSAAGDSDEESDSSCVLHL
ncbi:ARID4A [Bugula neritina]|uniref:ARID4A n=1 Tax=Bugula neritina TaxID=10212 RepID=A0A7J7IV67_BUGNE|nr:ARID4A [Bugula neritina]